MSSPSQLPTLSLFRPIPAISTKPTPEWSNSKEFPKLFTKHPLAEQDEITHFNKFSNHPREVVAEQERNDKPLIEISCHVTVQEIAPLLAAVRVSKTQSTMIKQWDEVME
jgi:hypothetical protein